MKFYVESYGCTTNFGEGDQLSSKMRRLGHTEVHTCDEADIVILNTCTVVETTEKKMIKRMNELRSSGKSVIVTGCMAKVQGNRIQLRLPEAEIIPPDQYDLFSGKVESKFGCGTDDTIKSFGKTAIIPISQGCLGHCTYCITKFARGKLISRSEDEILSEFQEMLNSGVKEFLITAQDTACYGKDIGTNLPSLIKSMLDFHGDYRIRIGMMNPNYLDNIVDDLIRLFDDERVYRFLHIPVQSGSNTVLQEMNRKYTVERFLGLINHIRENVPDISIATDMICGFPGESDKDHEKNLKLIYQLGADTVNITRFSPRQGTVAYSMKNQVNGNVSKDRSKELTDLKNKVESEINKKMVGKKYTVLVTEKGKENSVIGRTNNYRPVAINEEIELGNYVNVEITGAFSTYLIGRII